MIRPILLAFGYNTNGFAHHDVLDAIDVMAELGYEGVALTLDVHHLHPLRASARDVERVAAALRARSLRSVVETGARYILDPRRKHEPTLLDPDPEARAARMRYLEAAIAVARDLGAEAVALFSGRLPAGVGRGEGFARLAEGVARLLDRAAAAGSALAFEPEPGMLVETLDDWERLRAAAGPALALTLDVGHVRVSEAGPIEAAIARAGPHVANVHIEDIRGRAHEHLPFGEGDIDFPPVLAALERAVGRRALVNVELSRHSHDAPEQARRAIAFLRAAAERRDEHAHKDERHTR